MEASPFEKNLCGGTVRASACVNNLFNKEEAMHLLQEISLTYPILNEHYENGKFYQESKPIITESEIDFNDDYEDENKSICDFMTKVMSTYFSSNNIELFIIKIKRKSTSNSKIQGAVLLSISHALCDGALVAQILGDLLSLSILKHSDKDAKLYKRPKIEHKSQLEIVKDLKSNLQAPEDFENERKFDLISIPPPLKENMDPEKSGKLYYKGICLNFDISKIIEVCHSIKVRPQAFFTAADIFSICGAVNEISQKQNFLNDPNKPFSIVSQISVNARKFINISPYSPTCYAAPVYIMSNIDNEVNGRSLMLHVQEEINQKVEKFTVPHLKAYCEGKFPPVANQGWASNVGIVESEVPIFVQGGAYQIPEAARANRGFTSHIITSKSKANKNAFSPEKAGCIVLTFLSPSCDEEFIHAMTRRFEWFLKNPSEAKDVKILGGVIPNDS